MRLATIKTGVVEEAAVIMPEGALTVAETDASQNVDWPAELSTDTLGAVVLCDGDVLECYISGFGSLSNLVGRWTWISD